MHGRDQDVVPRRVMSAYWGLRSGLRAAVSGRLANRQMCRQPTDSIKPLYFCLLGDLQRIVNLDSEVAHRALELAVSE
jgi:hypothetical protein